MLRVQILPDAYFVMYTHTITMDITKNISKLIENSLTKNGYSIPISEITVERTTDLNRGDYYTNIAMKFAKSFGKNPIELAQEIQENIAEDQNIEKIEVVKPGFINFFVSSKYLYNQLIAITKNREDIFKSHEKEGERILIEYTDANPFKVLHVGHLYTNTVGESLCRLQSVLGADVKRATYQGDVGLHVAKTMWGLRKKLSDESMKFEDLERFSLKEKVKFLGDAYILGSEVYDCKNDGEVKEEIEDINYYIFSLSTPSLAKKDFSRFEELGMQKWYLEGRRWCLEYFEEIYKKLGTKFDYYYLESEVGEAGLRIVLENLGTVFKEDDGAIIYEGDEKKNLHTRVFVNKHGLPTYEAKELGLAFKKFKETGYDRSVVITGKEQKGYFAVVMDALRKIDPKVVEGMIHIPHGLIKTSGGEKMSSRKGGFVGGEWLIEKTTEKIIDVMSDGEKMNVEDIASLSERIAIGAIKYAFLKVSIGNDIVFDFDRSITFDGNTGPYLMYVYSRCNSLLKNSELVNTNEVYSERIFENPFAEELGRYLSMYNSVLLSSARRWDPSELCNYLFNLGQKFNSLYQNVRILDSDSDDRAILLLEVKAVMTVMKDGLDHLGIECVDVM